MADRLEAAERAARPRPPRLPDEYVEQAYIQRHHKGAPVRKRRKH